ncbi:MAG: VPLPA-CTERM sorting domain-containing protein [Gammaproteobacteria bacterium]
MKVLKLLTAIVVCVIAPTSMASTIFRATDIHLHTIYEDNPGLSLYMFNDEDTGFANPLLAPVGDAFENTGAGGRDYVATNGDLQTRTLIPVPPAVWLLGSGLIGLVAVARRRV